MVTISTIPLHRVKKGSLVRVVDVPDGKNKARLIRLGILRGEVVRCREKLPGGTIVVEKNRQEIAIGVTLAKTILVAYVRTEIP